MDLLGVGNKPEIEFILDPQGTRQKVDVRIDDQNKRVAQYLYYQDEDVKGTVVIKLKKTSKFEHQGIRLDFIGQIEMLNDRSTTYEFTNLSKVLAYPGEISEQTTLNFEFSSVAKPHETYYGINTRIRYFLRLTIIKRIFNVVNERDICVRQISSPDHGPGIKMEVGIEDCLHIEFEYNKSKYHLKDVIVGKIYFLLVRIKIKHMEIAILRKESISNGSNPQTETETIAKYEIMDGAPVKGENIPIRLFLGAFDLSPTMRDTQRKFSVRYFLNLVLFDEEERRYFKQQEIILWRKNELDQEKNSAEQYSHYDGRQNEQKNEEKNFKTPKEKVDPNEDLDSTND